MADRLIDDARRLQKLLRKSRKAAKKISRIVGAVERDIERAIAPPPWSPPAPEPEPAPTPPARWILSGKQLHEIVMRLNLSDAGTYVKTAEALGIKGDLYAMLDETYRSACRLGMFSAWKDQWLESYRDAKAAYAWHLSMADASCVETDDDRKE